MRYSLRDVSGYNVEIYGFPSALVYVKERADNLKQHYLETPKAERIYHPYERQRQETDEERLYRLTEADLIDNGLTEEEHLKILQGRIMAYDFSHLESTDNIHCYCVNGIEVFPKEKFAKYRKFFEEDGLGHMIREETEVEKNERESFQ